MIETITNYLEEKKYIQIKELIENKRVQDLADLLDSLPDDNHKIKLFRLFPKTMGAEVFSYARPQLQEFIVKALTDKEISIMIEEMYFDDAVDFLEEMPANVVEKVLKNSNKETRLQINKLLSYDDDTAGSIMTTEFLDLKSDTTVADAFKRIKRIGKEVETINMIYVTSPGRKLVGELTIKDLLLADENTKVEDIMKESTLFITTSTDNEEVVQIFNKYDTIALPVVDAENLLVGIVTFDDVMRVMEEETTEDFHIMSAITPTNVPYLKMPPYKLASNRVVWLTCLMISAIFTGMLITFYEKAFAVLPTLIACLPMLMGTGGNCGTQASTLVIRGLALNEIKFKDYFRVWLKEIQVSLLIALCLCSLNFAIVLIQYKALVLSITVSCSLFFVILIANFLGFSLPILAKKLKLDPAVMAAPILTTILDCAVILIYFNIAKLLLGI